MPQKNKQLQDVMTSIRFLSRMSRIHDLDVEDHAASPKVLMRRHGEKLLKYVAQSLGFEKGHFNLSYHPAGIAVSGDVTLHSDHLYLELNESSCGGVEILYRQCHGMKDSVGGHNYFKRVEHLLEDEDDVAESGVAHALVEWINALRSLNHPLQSPLFGPSVEEKPRAPQGKRLGLGG